MKKYFLGIFFLVSFNVHAEDLTFIGHGYGDHGGKTIPYQPLKLFLEKHKNIPNIRIWGGDLTEDENRFPEFQSYLKEIGGVNLLVRGNHDGNLYSKIPFWSDYVTPGGIWINNFDMDGDMKFSSIQKQAGIIASHYVWFNQVYAPFNFPNSMMGADSIDLLQIKFIPGRHLYIAGDCGGLLEKNPGYIETQIGSNIFACSGMGGDKNINNIVIIGKNNSLSPIFFNIHGEIIPHVCKFSRSSSPFRNNIKYCGSEKQINTIN